MKKVIINVNLEYSFDVETDKEARIAVKNVELPKGYVEDSFKLVRITEADEENEKQENS